jgi:lytic cellulose monooxygenase (C1-hydroxylating)
LKAWVIDDLISKNNLTRTVQVLTGVKPGAYVLRYGILVLHSAWKKDGAQAYPQYINLMVEGDGKVELPKGTDPRGWYTEEEKSVLVNVYDAGALAAYPFPEPKVWGGK